MRRCISELNRVSREDFVRLVGPAFEHSPWIALEAAEKRPFADVDEMHRQLCKAVRLAPEEKQLALIQAHPDLAQRGALTAESTREQASAGLDKL
jgi:2-oxo-4-hydroxy-4-carboxy-5-ureidoimidazoline decarboxylase